MYSHARCRVPVCNYTNHIYLKAKIITAWYEVMMDLHRRPEIELTRVIREDVLNGDFPSEFEGMSCTPLAKEMAMGLHAKWIRTPWERKKDMDIEMGVVDATLIRGMKNFNEKLVAIPASDPRPLSTAAATTTTKASRSSRDRSRRRDSDRSRDRSPHTRQRSRDSAQCRYRSPKIHRGGHW